MKLLMVDDEIAMIEIMKRAVDWEGIGIDTLFSANNAVSARAILQKEQVDIVICDIEMPQESGLQLLHWMREQGLETECIILTAYPDFNYAKDAVSLQVTDYLLKPVVFKELISTVQSCVDKILKKRAESKYKMLGERVLSDWRENMKSILRKLIWDEITMTDARRRLKELGCSEKSDQPMHMVLYRCVNLQSVKKRAGKSVRFVFENVMDEIASQSVNLCIDYVPVQIYIGDGSAIGENCQRFFDVASQFLKCELQAFVLRNLDMGRLSDSFDFLLETASAAAISVGTLKAVEDNESKTEPGELIFDRSRWSGILLVMNRDEILKQASSEIKRAEERGILSPQYLQLYRQEFLRMFYKVSDVEVRMLNKDGQDSLELFDSAAKSAQDMLSWIEMMATCSAVYREKEVEQNDVERARTYLEEHYNESISREDIEQYVHLNRDYLNRIFKSTTGYSLMEYIQYYRVQKAKHMLKHSQESISNICLMVGYDSPPYFSKIFKKQTGQTPLEYRNQNA